MDSIADKINNVFNLNNNSSKSKMPTHFKLEESNRSLQIVNDVPSDEDRKVKFQLVEQMVQSPMKFQRTNKRKHKLHIIKNIIPNEIKQKNREIFKRIYLKVQIVLLFKFMLRRVKFYGLNILKEDIKEELEAIEGNENLLRFISEPQRKNIGPYQNMGMITRNPTQGFKLKKFVKKHLIINPEGKFKIIWNTILLFLVVYTIIIMSVAYCFFDNPAVFSTWWFMELIPDLFFVCDLILNLFVADINQTKPKWGQILYSYATSWLIVDFISVFPFHWLTNISYDTQMMFRVLKLLRIFRFTRIIQQNKKIRKYLYVYFQLSGGINRIVIIFVSLITLTHIFACLWYFFARYSNYYDTWIHRYNLLGENLSFVYITSFYFTFTVITTVGFGDIVPQTPLEKILICLLMMFGAMTTSFLVSNMVTLLTNYDNHNHSSNDRMGVLNSFANKNRISSETYIKIKKFFEENGSSSVFEEHSAIMCELPYYLRMEIMFHMHENNIHNIFYFKDKRKSFIVDVITVWSKISFRKNEFLFLKNDWPEYVYFLTNGKCVYLDERGNVLTVFTKGAILGEIEVILDYRERINSLVCVETNCEMFQIKSELFKEILLKYPQEFISSQKMAKIKTAKYKEITKGMKDRKSIKLMNKMFVYQNSAAFLKQIQSLRGNEPDVDEGEGVKPATTQLMKVEPHLSSSMSGSSFNSEANDSLNSFITDKTISKGKEHSSINKKELQRKQMISENQCFIKIIQLFDEYVSFLFKVNQNVNRMRNQIGKVYKVDMFNQKSTKDVERRVRLFKKA